MTFAEFIRLTMLLVYEFAFDHLVLLLSVFLVQSILRGIVVSNFAAQVLIIKGVSTKKVFISQVIYYIILLGILVTIFALALAS